jgi:hypothetical protein
MEARMSEPSAMGFQNILRHELRRRGVDGAGAASITVKDNHATLNWLWQGKKCRLSLDRHYDRYMDGFEYRRELADAIDHEFFLSTPINDQTGGADV